MSGPSSCERGHVGYWHTSDGRCGPCDLHDRLTEEDRREMDRRGRLLLAVVAMACLGVLIPLVAMRLLGLIP